MNNLQILLLTALKAKEEPASGYDLTCEIEPKTGSSRQQVYRELNKLRESGHLTSYVIPGVGRPDRIVYSISPGVTIPTVKVKRDFSKTADCFWLACLDVNDGGNRALRYQNMMAEAEREIVKQINKPE